jgi:hypothetical protein
MAGVVVLGLCMLRGPAPAGVTEHGQFYLRAIPASAVHHVRAPHIHLREGTSLNWSGYAVETNLLNPESNAVSDAVGSWTVPAVVKSSSSYTYSSAWVGIDGYSDNTVEQIGTEQDWTPEGGSFYAWFEMYPNYAYEIVGFPVVPGDEITAQVQYTGSDPILFGAREGPESEAGRKNITGAIQFFQLTITNVTEDVAFTIRLEAKGAERQSAEWIMEAPSGYSVLPLADFGTVHFYGCEATLNGVTGPINDAAWKYDALTMETNQAVTKALPSALGAGGKAFSVAWHHE